MRLKLDENMPSRLKSTLAHLGHDTDTCPDEGLIGATDTDLWNATQAARGAITLFVAGEGILVARERP